MILLFEFSYASNNDLFVPLIHCVLKSDECVGVKFKHQIVKEHNKIKLYISSDEAGLSVLSDVLSRRLPHSLFLLDTNVSALNEGKFLFNEGALSLQIPEISNITPVQIQSFLNQKELNCNEFGILSDMRVNGEAVNSANFNSLLTSCLNALLDKKSVSLSDKFHSFSVAAGVIFSDSCYIMPTNLKHISRLFIADEAAGVCLASFEKPLVKLRLSAIYKNAHEGSPKYFHVGLARDIFMYALCVRLSETGVDFLSIKASEYFSEPFIAMPCENGSVVCSGEGYLSNVEADFVKNSDDKNFALYALSAYEFGLLKQESSLRVFLSKTRADEVEIVKNGESTRVLRFGTISSWEEIFSEISRLEGGERLLENYKKEFSLPSGGLNLKEGFFAIFAMAGLLLGLSDDMRSAGEAMLELSSEFNANRGVRIEFKMQSATEFDIARAIRSVMSFRLAGAGEKNIAYGLAESLAHFLDEFIANVKNECSIKLAIGSGSLFANKALLSLCAKHAGVKFSREYALESGV
ncbi:hypothetical protein [Campylobacter sp. 19-13652]|uniref:Kae1-like domain-containing protein n=1 Tax=Campylobacter sp. 19-13652 TaxID=2840180 RepID=UPI001C741F80|nr:hypothetical protein [Campylobacter sp. 19-13652]BCX79614.1 hypothetical protein LBC_10760 [Campylobacter sp. 19-13652]